MKKNIFWEFIKKHKIAILLILVMATAIFFRLYKLGQIPPGLYPDVAINGNDALQALKSGDFKAFYPENNGREGLFMNLIAASFWLFGASVWAIKIVPAILGILTILGIYLLTFHLFSFGRLMQKKFSGDAPKYIGLLAAFFTAVSFWHVNFSRLGFRAIMAPFCLVWSFYFLFKVRRISRSVSRFFIVSRLSNFFLPRPMAISTFTYLPLLYIPKGTIVKPAVWLASSSSFSSFFCKIIRNCCWRNS